MRHKIIYFTDLIFIQIYGNAPSLNNCDIRARHTS